MPLLHITKPTHVRPSGWGDLERVFSGAMLSRILLSRKTISSAGMEVETKRYRCSMHNRHISEQHRGQVGWLLNERRNGMGGSLCPELDSRVSCTERPISLAMLSCQAKSLDSSSFSAFFRRTITGLSRHAKDCWSVLVQRHGGVGVGPWLLQRKSLTPGSISTSPSRYQSVGTKAVST